MKLQVKLESTYLVSKNQHSQPGGWHRVRFYKDGMTLQSNVQTRNMAKKNRRANWQWSFRSSDQQGRLFMEQHELPIFAAFLLECHQRLSASIRDNKFNPKALENK